MNRLKDPIPTTDDALDVALTLTIPVGIKHEGRERVALCIVVYDIVTPDVEYIFVPMGVFLCGELMYVVG